MSKENINEEQVNETTSQATENENNAADLNKELNELRESNANLIAERDNLMDERKQLQDKIKSLEEKLEDEKSNRSRIYQWYTQEQDKVRALGLIIKAMKSDFVTIDQIVERITRAV